MKSEPFESVVKLEEQIASQTAAGREAIQVWRNVWRKMPAKRRAEKAFELTAEVREIMRAGIRSRNPDASDKEIQRLYVNQLLAAHGTSLEQIRQKQKEELFR